MDRTLDSARRQWDLNPDVTYLNHGSFGPPPRPVREARQAWQAALDANPMDFFCRRYEPAWWEARRRLANFVGADADGLIFTENATAAMNLVADAFPLGRDDEVLLTDHEYGAVQRIWRRAASRAGAAPPRIANLPLPVSATEKVIEAVMAEVNSRTRLLVISQITSPTAIILPVAGLAAAARERGLAVCIDGPHALAQLHVDLGRLDCDFYCASCHKWLSAPFGSGFLYAAPQQRANIQPQQISWGRLAPNRPETWSDEFLWSGTRDPSAWLSVPAAIDFLAAFGLDRFRESTHALARYARRRLTELIGMEPLVPDSAEWYGCMAHQPLPPGEAAPLQRRLWEAHRIEVPIVEWKQRRWIRVSCHLYNTQDDIEHLVTALSRCLAAGG